MTQARFVSYAQNLEDVMLWRALGGAVPTGGFYIDVGASDPTLLSVTRAFYERGWSGVNIEPLPEQAEKLRQARPRDVVVQAAVAAAPGQRAFHRVTQHDQTGLSTFDAPEAARHAAAGAAVETIDVPVTTLAAICQDHVSGPVHFLKIDAEGAESEVLAGADFITVRPWIVLIEATEPLTNSETGAAWEPALLRAGYRFVWFDGLNRFYLAEEHAGMAEHFRLPPNIFDDYVQYDAPLMAHLAATEALAAARYAAIDALRLELSQIAAATAGPQHQTGPVLAAAPAEPGPSVEPEAPPPPPRPLLHRLAMLAYRPVRPVLRPLVWRARTFLIGPLLEEMARLRQQLDELQSRPLANVRPTLDPAISAAMERLMLTLALQDARDRPPPDLSLLDPPPPAPASKDGLSKPEARG
jgi:FkbM family methyltransferase